MKKRDNLFHPFSIHATGWPNGKVIQIICPLKLIWAFWVMVSHRHFYLMATAKEAREAHFKGGSGVIHHHLSFNLTEAKNISTDQTPGPPWPQFSAAERYRKVDPPQSCPATGSVLPDTSPCEAPVRPMLVSRWSMLGTGWDSTALSSWDTVWNRLGPGCEILIIWVSWYCDLWVNCAQSWFAWPCLQITTMWM